MDTYINTQIYTYMYTYIHIFIYTYIYIDMYTYVQKHKFIYIYMCIYIYLRRWQDRLWTVEIKPKSASSILQALSCRFFGCNLLVCVSLAFMIGLCFVYFKNPSRNFFKHGRARFRQRQARGRLTLQTI